MCILPRARSKHFEMTHEAKRVALVPRVIILLVRASCFGPVRVNIQEHMQSVIIIKLNTY